MISDNNKISLYIFVSLFSIRSLTYATALECICFMCLRPELLLGCISVSKETSLSLASFICLYVCQLRSALLAFVLIAHAVDRGTRPKLPLYLLSQLCGFQQAMFECVVNGSIEVCTTTFSPLIYSSFFRQNYTEEISGLDFKSWIDTLTAALNWIEMRMN